MQPTPIRRRQSATTHAAVAPSVVAPRPVDVEALVSKYGAVGRQQRLTAKRRKFATYVLIPATGLLLVAGLVTAWRWLPDSSGTAAISQQLAELTTLKGEINAERLAWQEERRAFQQQSSMLLQQLTDISAQRQALDGQRQAFELRQEELKAALARLEGQSRQIDQDRRAAASQGPKLDKQVAELNRQRERLEQQREQFRSQSSLVVQELKGLDAQRRELETQQQALEQQRRELQSLMNRYEEAARPAAPGVSDGSPTDGARPTSGNAPEPTANMMASNAVADEVLGEMRGGIRIGDDLDISFGLTRSGSINGIEQFSNSVYIDNLSTLTSGAGLNPAQVVLLQQGLGNTVDLGAMDALSGNFGTVIQNTLDNQLINTMTVIDVSLQNASSVISGISASDAISQSLSLPQ